jgi:hypothetical protein
LKTYIQRPHDVSTKQNTTKLGTKINCERDLNKFIIIIPVTNTYQTSFPLLTYLWWIRLSRHHVFQRDDHQILYIETEMNTHYNPICLYRRIWLVTILSKILNLQVVTKGFSWKNPPSWMREILLIIFTTMHRNN